MKQAKVVELTAAIALKASLMSIRHKLTMTDSLIYATAQTLGAVVWTQDEHFRDLPGVNYRQSKNLPGVGGEGGSAKISENG